MTDDQLLQTSRAFDGVADTYDGPTGNNIIVQYMRAVLWREVERSVPPGGRILDLGCGTGLDLAHFASRGFDVVGIDSSPLMVQRARERLADGQFPGSARTLLWGIEELSNLQQGLFDLIYSDLGPLNCVPDLVDVARASAARLNPGGRLIASVIGRGCPWELLYYSLRGDRARAFLRLQRGSVPVSLKDQTIWTRYYSPREFLDAFAGSFDLGSYRSLALIVPPPYLEGIYRRMGPLAGALTWLDDRIAGVPLARDLGDHFLVSLVRRDGGDAR